LNSVSGIEVGQSIYVVDTDEYKVESWKVVAVDVRAESVRAERTPGFGQWFWLGGFGRTPLEAFEAFQKDTEDRLERIRHCIRELNGCQPSTV